MPDSPDDASRRPPRPLTRPFRTPAVTRAVPAGPASDAARRSGTAPFRAPFRPTPAGLPAQPQGIAPATSGVEEGDRPAAATVRPNSDAAPVLLEEFRGTEAVSPAAEQRLESTAEPELGGDTVGGDDDMSLAPTSAEALSSTAEAELVPSPGWGSEAASPGAAQPTELSATPSHQWIDAEVPVEAGAASVGMTAPSAGASAEEAEPHAARASSAAEEWPEDVWTADGASSESDTGEFWTAGDPDLSLGTRRAEAVPAAASEPAFYFPTDTDERGGDEQRASAVGTEGGKSGRRAGVEPSADSDAYQPVLNAMNSPAAAAEWTRLTAGTPAEGTPMPLAEALEVLASRIRAGTLQASGYEPGMGDAAALTAALAAVLGVKR